VQEMLSFSSLAVADLRDREAQANAACVSTAQKVSPPNSQCKWSRFGSSFRQVDGGWTFSRAESPPFANEGVSGLTQI